MKHLIRQYLINLGALWATTEILPALTVSGEIRGVLIGALALMLTNIFLVPLLKVLLLPLNLLTLGLFAWLSNVLALYFLTITLPYFQVSSYQFLGFTYQGFVIPSFNLSPFFVVVLASLILGFIIHFLNWLIK